MNKINNNMRNKRNLLDINSLSFQFPVANYSTDAQKQEMEQLYGDNLILNKLPLLPDPLRKNLADFVITGEKTMKSKAETKEYPSVKPSNDQETYNHTSRGMLTNIMAGIYNIVGAFFTSHSEYHDCQSKSDEMAPPSWQPSSTEVLNKNEPVDMLFNDTSTKLDETMNVDCIRAADQCQRKLDEVRSLIGNKSKLNAQRTKQKPSRPKKVFVEPSSVEEKFEDAFCPESCISQPCNVNIEYHSPYNCHSEQFATVASCKVRPEEIKESMDIVKDLENKSKDNVDITKTDDIVSVCDDKMNKLKSLLQSKICKKNIESEPIPIPEIPSENLIQSSQESDCFNEVSGKFISSSMESEDSFQIVFTDELTDRKRLSSDCESEDSFIVFEENSDSCYMSNDVFGDDVNESDSDESDEPLNCKLLPSLSRTFCDLTDNSLYIQNEVDALDEVDEVDSAIVNTLDDTNQWDIKQENNGLLLDAKRKMEKKKLPPKKVRFSSDPPKVHVMRVWAFAARQARAGHWERHALDRERFKRRIADVEMAISWVLKPQHRTRVVFQRFRPWWNAQRRKELEEKKLEEENRKNREAVDNGEKCLEEETDNNKIKNREGEAIKKSVEINGLDVKYNNVNGFDNFDENKTNIDITEEMPKIIEKFKALHINGTVLDMNVISNENVT